MHCSAGNGGNPRRSETGGWGELARYGVAYGLDDLAHARATRHLTLGVLQAQEAKGRQTVRDFVALTQSRFG
ncbi:MAG: hypothetical protein V4586_08230 [Pseudomonadota bacterium]